MACRGIGNRSRKLAGDDRQRVVCVALLQALADADYGNKTGAIGGPGLCGDGSVRFRMCSPALGMAHDNEAGARIRQHFGAGIAGVSAGRLGVAILPAQPDAGPGQGA